MTDDITLDAPETPLERFLAAAAGMDGITLDEPVTRIEKYLYKIAQGSGGGSGGGVLVVHDVDGTLDKKWQEIHDAFVSGGVIVEMADERTEFQNAVIGVEKGREYRVTVAGQGNWSPAPYTADATDGYPAHA